MDSLLISSGLSSLLVLLYFHGPLLRVYNLIALASTATALVAIGVTCLAELTLLRREPSLFTKAQRLRGPVTALLGLAIVVVMIAGCGATVIGWTLAAAAVPLPYALWMQRRNTHGRSRSAPPSS